LIRARRTCFAGYLLSSGPASLTDDKGVSADTWWWTEIPLDVAGKDADLTQSDRQVELEFRTIGWDEQPGSVLSHTPGPAVALVGAYLLSPVCRRVC
jgi:hypothetical protein